MLESLKSIHESLNGATTFYHYTIRGTAKGVRITSVVSGEPIVVTWDDTLEGATVQFLSGSDPSRGVAVRYRDQSEALTVVEKACRKFLIVPQPEFVPESHV